MFSKLIYWDLKLQVLVGNVSQNGSKRFVYVVKKHSTRFLVLGPESALMVLDLVLAMTTI